MSLDVADILKIRRSRAAVTKSCTRLCDGGEIGNARSVADLLIAAAVGAPADSVDLVLAESTVVQFLVANTSDSAGAILSRILGDEIEALLSDWSPVRGAALVLSGISPTSNANVWGIGSQSEHLQMSFVLPLRITAAKVELAYARRPRENSSSPGNDGYAVEVLGTREVARERFDFIVWRRATLAATAALAVARRCVTATLARIRRRRISGQLLSAFSAVRSVLADCFAELLAADALLVETFALDTGSDAANTEKQRACLTMAYRVVSRARTLWGGDGLLRWGEWDALGDFHAITQAFPEIADLKHSDARTELGELLFAAVTVEERQSASAVIRYATAAGKDGKSPAAIARPMVRMLATVAPGGPAFELYLAARLFSDVSIPPAVALRCVTHRQVAYSFLSDPSRWNMGSMAAGLAGSGALGAIAITEATGGGPAAIQTYLSKEGDGWRLRGTKTFVACGLDCDFTVVAAVEGSSNGTITLAIVDLSAPGVSVRPLELSAWTGVSFAEIEYDCVVATADVARARPGVLANALCFERYLLAIREAASIPNDLKLAGEHPSVEETHRLLALNAALVVVGAEIISVGTADVMTSAVKLLAVALRRDVLQRLLPIALHTPPLGVPVDVRLGALMACANDALGSSHAGGSPETQRELVAAALLGSPDYAS
jgi:alkylation response protein AidB-like acyl-CoA dehydrogenase